MSGRSAVAVLRADFSSLPRLERFVDDFTGAGERERMRVKIVAGELFDNLVAHARGVRPPFAFVSLSSVLRLTLTFRFRASNLEAFLSALDEARAGGKPRFDEAAGLYRGFGLRMCVRLASSIEVRRGLSWHRVSVVFS
jgi:hypothetical protein